MTLLAIRDLSVRYAENAPAALDGITLEVRQGERLGVIGESGSGKSTLAAAIAGILPRSAALSGAIEWPKLGRPARAGADVGIVFQDPSSSLDPVMRVGEQVAEVAHAHLGQSWSAARAAAADLLDRVKLPDPAALARAWPHQLSGGQRQRVAIAAAIAAEPKLLIADEATSALDTIVQAGIVRLLDGLVRERGMTLIFISHDIALASQLVDRIAVLKDARLVEIGPTEEVLRRPKSAYARSLIDACIGIDT
ncbi:MAG: ABC transporter ATP-binding protein [Rhizobiales bacterium]|nr:ABC transporter ATP-binding protein [Hyphomicrobiales bacterium]